MRGIRPGVARAGVVLLAAAAGGACGYALAGRGTFLPDYIRVVAIPTAENRTSEARVQETITDRLRTEFIGRGRYSVVRDAAGADALLRVVITSLTAQPAILNDRQLARRYIFTVTMQVTFEDQVKGEVLWSNDALTFREEYELSSGLVEGAPLVDQQRSSFERLAGDVARTVVTAIVEAF